VLTVLAPFTVTIINIIFNIMANDNKVVNVLTLGKVITMGLS
jgi:hypothetical protein